MKSFFILFLSLLSITFSTAQSSDVCECCTLSWMQSQHEFKELFPPDVIQKNKITSALVSRKSKSNIDSTAKPSDTKMELEFYFDASGYVKSITFYQSGQPFFATEFLSGTDHRYTQKLLFLLDSTGKKLMPTPQEDWRYLYTDRLLTKLIKADALGNIKHDSISDYISFKYDSLNRIMEETEQLYSFSSNPLFNYTKTTFDDKTSSATAVTGTKDFIVTTSQLSFNAQKKLIYEKLIEHKNNKTIREKFIRYNQQNQLERIELKSYQELTDCPDGGNYVDVFLRNDKGLFKQIIHTYAAYTCTMDFLYRH